MCKRQDKKTVGCGWLATGGGHEITVCSSVQSSNDSRRRVARKIAC